MRSTGRVPEGVGWRRFLFRQGEARGRVGIGATFGVVWTRTWEVGEEAGLLLVSVGEALGEESKGDNRRP